MAECYLPISGECRTALIVSTLASWTVAVGVFLVFG